MRYLNLLSKRDVWRGVLLFCVGFCSSVLYLVFCV